ncbi:hydroxymethylbilane synthase [Microbacterium luticocti]|uniref:hydroxymethylbilane synthase n=1 Tax=Microbacterium luticocti TaxID=451764 RepID=UPI00041B2C69|nr:hydroxymethylbilane synthase [Microbacterium luticocti]
MTLRVGTRGSALAVAQTQLVADALAAALGGVDVEIVRITTHGDTSRASLSSLGGTGVFATALRDALREGRCDVIVHSFKDLPTAPSPGLTIGAVPVREDARDVVVTRDGTLLDRLPAGARVGTGSPRRVAQVRSVRPDLEVVDIRGNVDSRLARLDAAGDERLDAVVLAAAGLSRLGRVDVAAEHMPLTEWPTAPAQGALAVEVRAEDAVGTPLADALAVLNDPVSAACAAAERGVLAGLQTGCAAPLGATATITGGCLTLTAAVYAVDGTRRLEASHTIAVGALATPTATIHITPTGDPADPVPVDPASPGLAAARPAAAAGTSPTAMPAALIAAADQAARIVTVQLLADGAADLTVREDA